MQRPLNYPTKPKALWDIFYDFTQTPRPSKYEEKIRSYLLKLANDNGIDVKIDKVGNVIMYVPGKNGRENDEPVLIQNHIDMVTDALPNINIDFREDPIETEVVDGWLTAVGTTLGADNGIGCAASLATIFETDMVHPPLELLFTVDEETGLHGALNLEPEYFSAKKMLNLDTEEWGSVYIGCAGGIDYEFNGEFEVSEVDPSLQSLRLDVSGFIGGHSGVEIHEQRANAIKVLSEILHRAQNEFDFNINEIRAGKAHNIIPRDAFCNLVVKNEDISKFEVILKSIEDELKSFLPKNDHKFNFSLSKSDKKFEKALNVEQTRKIINFMILFPHGVFKYDLESSREIVSSSNNFAKLLLVDGKFYTQSSLRFFDRQEIKEIESKMRSLGQVFNLKVESMSEYPSWKPQRENSILNKVLEVYEATFNEKANITAIHAGLECGILKDKIGDIEVVSFGPTIKGAHSPDEKVDIESVSKFWLLFKNLLKEI